MAKYAVWGIMTASIKIGEYEAENEQEARDMADNDKDADWYPTLCHQCAKGIDLSDIYETQADIING